MSHARPLTPLPSTRMIRRRSRTLHRGWLIGLGLTIVVNGGVILALSQASTLSASTPAFSLPVRTIERTDPPPPPPHRPALATPTLTTATPMTATPVTTAPKIPLPALALSPTWSDTGLALPEGTGSISDLPALIPAFSSVGDVEVPGELAAGPEPTDLVFDQAPQLLHAIDLAQYYPRSALARRTTGQSTIRLDISETGTVTVAQVINSDPPGVFDQAAERLAMALQFSPATRGGTPISSRIYRTIMWTLTP